MIVLKRFLFLIFILLYCFSLLAEPGHLVLSGGALKGNNAEIYGKIIELASEDLDGDGEVDIESARIGIITASSSDPYYAEDNGAYYVSRFQQHGAYAEWIPLSYDPAYPTTEYDPDYDGEIEAYYAGMNGSADIITQINSMTGFFFGGGDQSRYIRVLMNNDHSDSPALAAIRNKVMNQGAVVSGSSAGTAIQCGGNNDLVVSNDWNIHQYIEPDPGLPNGFVNAILKDSDGKTWMSTDEGVAVLENGEWTEYNAENSGFSGSYSTIYDIDQAPDGTFWFGTYGGIVHLDGSNWEYFSINNAPLPANKSYAVATGSNGTLWVGTTYGIVSFDGISWTEYNQPEVVDLLVRAIEVETRPNGDQWIWIGSDGYTSGNDLCLTKYDTANDTWEYFYYQSQVEEDEVMDIAIDSNNIKWIGGYRGLHRYDDNNFVSFDPYSRSARSVALDSNDIPWIGFNYYGLVKFENDEFSYWATSNSDIPGNYLNDIWIDEDDTKWLATDGNGAAEFSADETWALYKEKIPPGLPDNNVNAVLPVSTTPTNTSIWIGTGNGLAEFNGADWEIIDENVLPDTTITTLHYADYKLWVGTPAGLITYEDDSWDVPAGAPDTHINAVYYTPEFPNPYIWLGTEDGLYRYDLASEWLLYDDPLINQPVNAIIEHENKLYLGCESGLFDMTSQGEVSPATVPGIVTVTSLAIAPDNKLWFGTSNGPMNLEGNNVTFWLEVLDGIYSISCDSKGNVYAASNVGIYKYNGEWNLLDTSNSELPSNMINFVVTDVKDNKWIGTTNGLAQFIEDESVSESDIPIITGGNAYRALIKGSYPFFTGEYDDLTYIPEGGFGFFPYGLLDSHFSRRGRQGRAIRLAADLGLDMVFGVDENAALVTYNVGSDDVYMEVLGQYRENGVNILDFSEAQVSEIDDYWSISEIKTHYLTKHDKYFPLTKEVVFADWKNEISATESDPFESPDIFESPYNPRPNYQSDYLSEYMFVTTRLFESTSTGTFGYTYEDTPIYVVQMVKDNYWDPQGFVGGYGNETYWSYKNLRVDIYPSAASIASMNIPNAPAYLQNNFPNPFNPKTKINYSVQKPGQIEILVYNIKGQLVKKLIREEKEIGTYSVEWNSKDNSNKNVASGVYFYSIKHNNEVTDVNKMLLLK